MNKKAIPATLRAIRARLDLTQEQLAERLGVSFATVNRWEGGLARPQRAPLAAIAALAAEAGVEGGVGAAEAAIEVTRRRGRQKRRKPMSKPVGVAAYVNEEGVPVVVVVCDDGAVYRRNDNETTWWRDDEAIPGTSLWLEEEGES